MKKTIISSGLCNICKKVIPSEKIIEGNYVFMVKKCDTHGNFKELISKDSKRFFDKTFSSPGKNVFERQTGIEKGCPSDCGWCPSHKQHLCSALIEITSRCNFNCPVCYNGNKDSKDISIDEFTKRLNTILRTENNNLDVLQISGGEPTNHPNFIEILKYAADQNINRILINTNGHLLLHDENIYNCINELKDRVEIYLQFDGYNADINKNMRGIDLVNEKLELISKLDNDNIKMCLAVTVSKENLSEIKDIIDLSCKTKNITGITFQRLTKTGNGESYKSDDLTQEDILYAIDETGYLKYNQIVPLPCSHENCTSISFLFIADGKSYPLADFIDFSKHKSIVQNKIGFQSNILDYLRNELCKDGCCSYFIQKLPAYKKLIDFTEGKGTTYKDMKMLRIGVKNFMDVRTFDTERAQKCCVGVSVGNEKIIPFCVNNIFNKRT